MQLMTFGAFSHHGTQAFAEGWGIFSTDEKDNPFQLQKLDEADAFADDLEAWRFVVRAATDSSEYHLKALGLLRRKSPAEFRKISDSFTTLLKLDFSGV